VVVLQTPWESASILVTPEVLGAAQVDITATLQLLDITDPEVEHLVRDSGADTKEPPIIQEEVVGRVDLVRMATIEQMEGLGTTVIFLVRDIIGVVEVVEVGILSQEEMGVQGEVEVVQLVLLAEVLD